MTDQTAVASTAVASTSDGSPTVDQRHGGGAGVLISFGPWIAVWVLTSNSSYVPGLLVAVGISVGLIGWTYWEGKRPKLLDWGTFVIMAVFTVVALVVDESWLGNWLNPILNGSLCLLMVLTVAVGRPFTIEYAKEEAPPEVWDSPQFTHINLVITGVWILAALAMTIGSAVDTAYSTGIVASTPQTAKNVESWANWGVTVIALVVAMKFTGWYPDAYMARQGRLQGAA
jgi:hypothetical protein